MVEIEAGVFTICQRLRDGQVTVPILFVGR